MAVISCSKDENLDDPNTSIANPEGTITVNIDSNGNGVSPCEMSNFHLISGNFTSDRNDYGSGNWTFADMGKMKGLGNVRAIPESGFASKVAVTEGHGYVGRYGSGRTAKYVRIYVQEIKEKEDGDIYKIQYQCPFEPTELTVSEKSLEFPKEGGKQTITVKSSIAEWDLEVYGYPSYDSDLNYFISTNYMLLSIEKDGNKLHITVLENPKAFKVSSTIYIYANEKTETISLTQAASDPYFNVNTTDINFDYNGGYTSIDVKTNTIWNVSSNVSWIYVSNSGYLKAEIQVGSNHNNEARVGIVTFFTSNTDPAISKTIKVKQEKYSY